MRNRTRGGLSVRGGDTGDGLSGMAVGDDVAVGTGDGLGVGGGGEAVGVGVGVETGGGRGTTDDSGDAVGEAVGGGGDGGGSLSAAMAIVAMTAVITAVTIVALIILRRRRRRWARSAATEDPLEPALAERDPTPDLAPDAEDDERHHDDGHVVPRIGDRRLRVVPRTSRHRNGGGP
jgi:hypothetical protein